MIVKGSKVKVTESYAGNLSNVIGKIGTVLDVKKDAGALPKYLLDVQGSRRIEGPYFDGGYYDTTSNVIAFGDEVEEFSYGLKDSAGNLLEIGDTVVYSSNRPGIIKGVVTDFRQFTQTQWSSSHEVVKVQLEVERPVGHYDGVRQWSMAGSYFQWYQHTNRMLIIRKNLNRLILDGMMDCNA